MKSFGLVALFLSGAVDLKAQVAYVNEYPNPGSGYGITTGPDGALWFTADVGIERISTSGMITKYAVPNAASSVPYGIASGPDGALWFTEYWGNKVGRITIDGVVTEYPIPTSGAIGQGITAGPDGALWFTEGGYANKIARITTGGILTEYPLPLTGPECYGPTGITVGADGALWFTDEAGVGCIGRITTGGTITEFPLAAGVSVVPIGITSAPDGALWFTESGSKKIGRITTGGVITEFPFPYGPSAPFWTTAGSDGALWFTGAEAGKIGRITTAGVITEYSIPSASPWGITSGPDGAVWYTDLATGIGQVVLSPPTPPSVSCMATPNTLWPPNGSSVPVNVSGIVTAGTSALAPGGTGYTVNDEYGQVQPSGSVALGSGGSYSFAVSLIAARDGNDKDGRTYTIVVNSQDISGKVGSCSSVVTVPHDQGN
jgi:virginiamycin B lyase